MRGKKSTPLGKISISGQIEDGFPETLGIGGNSDINSIHDNEGATCLSANHVGVYLGKIGVWSG